MIFSLKNGQNVTIQYANIEKDYSGDTYEKILKWLQKVDKYLLITVSSIENIEERKKNFLSRINFKDYFLLIAKFKGEIIAQAILEIKSKFKKTSHKAGIGISIHPDFHDLGLGTKMIQCLEEKAKKLGVLKIEMSVYESNERASYVYINKLGYKREGCRINSILLEDGSFSNEIILGKFL